jgi:hypothetical protein
MISFVAKFWNMAKKPLQQVQWCLLGKNCPLLPHYEGIKLENAIFRQ